MHLGHQLRYQLRASIHALNANNDKVHRQSMVLLGLFGPSELHLEQLRVALHGDILLQTPCILLPLLLLQITISHQPPFITTLTPASKSINSFVLIQIVGQKLHTNYQTDIKYHSHPYPVKNE